VANRPATSDPANGSGGDDAAWHQIQWEGALTAADVERGRPSMTVRDLQDLHWTDRLRKGRYVFELASDQFEVTP
jgi:hypothetical protein